MEWLSRIGIFSIGAVAGFAGAIALVVATIEPASQTKIDEIAKMDATFQRLPEHEALVAKILGAISLKSRIRVYLDTYNPSFCGHANAWHQTIVLTERCSELMQNFLR